jgi:hypothetical protein
MVLLGVLRAEQTLFAPEEAVGGVLIPAHIDQSRWHQVGLGDVATGCCHRFVFAGIKVVGSNVGQNSLTSQTATADALALFRHGESPLRGGLWIGQNKSTGIVERLRSRLS